MRKFERKYGLRSDIFFAAYSRSPEPQDIDTELAFSDWSDTYLAWQARQAEYRAEVLRLQGDAPPLQDLLALVRAEDIERRKQLLDWFKAHMDQPVTEEERALWRRLDAESRATFPPEDAQEDQPEHAPVVEPADVGHAEECGLGRDPAPRP